MTFRNETNCKVCINGRHFDCSYANRTFIIVSFGIVLCSTQTLGLKKTINMRETLNKRLLLLFQNTVSKNEQQRNYRQRIDHGTEPFLAIKQMEQPVRMSLATRRWSSAPCHSNEKAFCFHFLCSMGRVMVKEALTCLILLLLLRFCPFCCRKIYFMPIKIRWFGMMAWADELLHKASIFTCIVWFI